MLAAVDTDALLELVWAAPLAAISVSLTFALCIHGVARSNDARRMGNGTAATAYGALAILAGLAFFGAVLFGVIIITSKG
jgi:hypothetical protein